ncbi:MAG: phosphate acyltransferase [Candidatus Woesearchaeota archaeon]
MLPHHYYYNKARWYFIDLITLLKEKATKKKATILIAEGWDERCLQAAARLLSQNSMAIHLLGNPQEIKEKARQLGLDITNAVIVDSADTHRKQVFAQELYQLRKEKGMTQEEAHQLLENYNYFACMYVALGYADALAGSAICPTAELMRPALQILKGPGLVSEISVFTSASGKVFLCTDVSLNPQPTATQLAQIAGKAITAAAHSGIVPVVAFLSYSTKGSGGDSPELQLIREATSLAKQAYPEVVIDGELQVDAAVNSYAAMRKCPTSPIQGNATILVMPNLMASNIFGHAMMQFSTLTYQFAMLQGMKKPVGIIGRSVPVEAVERVLLSLAMEVNTA